MTKTKTLATILLFMAALLFAACGDHDPADCDDPSHAHVDEGQDQDVHDHSTGAHEGTVIVLGDHAAHIEVCVDHDLSMIEVYASDADMKPVRLDEPPVLKLMHEGKSHRLVAEAGESAEDGYIFEDPSLHAHAEKGRFEIKLGGATYTPDLPAHSHEGHEGEGHDHDAEGHEDHEGEGHDHDAEGHGDHEGEGHDHDAEGHEDHEGEGHDHDAEGHEDHDK